MLVVDDQPDAKNLAKRVLEDAGAEVVTAGSAHEAYDQLRRERPDVLLSDIGMPEEDGYSLLRRVRRLSAEEGGNTPAIALTAYARTEDRVEAIKAGYQAHVSKPFNPVELLVLVGNVAGMQ